MTRRLHSLDALRGIAAMGVAFCWHYVHFKPSFSAHRQEMPFFDTFRWFYDYGFTLVDLFFVLSGFIFLRTYADRVAAGKVSFREFAVNRLSRLYPLHLLTLIVVCGELAWTHLRDVHPFLYDNNNALFLVLNLLMVQSGWFGGDQSFNGPAWSIATEIIVYLVFFAAVALLKQRARYRVAFVAFVYLGLALLWRHGDDYLLFNSFTERALLGFFIGCLLSELAAWLEANATMAFAYQVAFVIITVVAVVAIRRYGFERVLFRYDLVLPIAVFPALILFALLNRGANWVLALWPFRILGLISFSIYLWHFPVQTVLSLIFSATGIAPETPFAFLVYATSVISISAASYYLFEQPMQSLIRQRFSGKAARSEVVAAEAQTASVAGVDA